MCGNSSKGCFGSRLTLQICLVSIDNRQLLVDLAVLEMKDFDIIFGMDWLVANYASVDCHGKRVIF